MVRENVQRRREQDEFRRKWLALQARDRAGDPTAAIEAANMILKIANEYTEFAEHIMKTSARSGKARSASPKWPDGSWRGQKW